MSAQSSLRKITRAHLLQRPSGGIAIMQIPQQVICRIVKMVAPHWRSALFKAKPTMHFEGQATSNVCKIDTHASLLGAGVSAW